MTVEFVGGRFREMSSVSMHGDEDKNQRFTARTEFKRKALSSRDAVLISGAVTAGLVAAMALLWTFLPKDDAKLVLTGDSYNPKAASSYVASSPRVV